MREGAGPLVGVGSGFFPLAVSKELLVHITAAIPVYTVGDVITVCECDVVPGGLDVPPWSQNLQTVTRCGTTHEVVSHLLAIVVYNQKLHIKLEHAFTNM